MITITWLAQDLLKLEINTILNTTVITIDFANQQINIAQEANFNWVNDIVNLVDDGNW